MNNIISNWGYFGVLNPFGTLSHALSLLSMGLSVTQQQFWLQNWVRGQTGDILGAEHIKHIVTYMESAFDLICL